MPLNDHEIEAYRRDGLVIPSDYRVAPETLARINELYQALLENNRDKPGFSPDFILGPHLDASGSYGIKGDPEWLEFARIPEILDMVEQLISERPRPGTRTATTTRSNRSRPSPCGFRWMVRPRNRGA